MKKDQIEKLVSDFPLVKKLINLEELSWFNPNITNIAEALHHIPLNENDVRDASDRLTRFAPYLMKAFPATIPNKGIIESEIEEIQEMKEELMTHYDTKINGKLFIKKDCHLPISGSIKARGGIYEVLKHAEDLAIKEGLITVSDDYEKFISPEFKAFFAGYKIAVGSTGNLGLSIGIMGSKLGFDVSVHMSADARQWKKDRLRSHGVTVVEYESDYGVAVEQGREKSKDDPKCFFIDDENSLNLFLGYSVAGESLKKQFSDQGIIVDQAHPLFVYLPCGVGGGPGGVAFGLKLAFGDDIHCIFAEPTHSPCMLLGVHTGLHDNISVQDIGIDNITAADGLAVGRASGFVGRAMERMLGGYFTIADEEMYKLLGIMNDCQKIKLEPSALAGVKGPIHVENNKDYLKRMDFSPEKMRNATHLVWATGGGMVPEKEMKQYLQASQLR
ncbi:D-serine ammonia-lyase [Psychromonas hadalis]|uniref:D-serine ammonia-lyase n=1 Tax=Psychromonas hadalis TaxID=211669 RepID=UPI0003B398B0|nr:D-serine ammonia-lyase [Psychromonas hadalis]